MGKTFANYKLQLKDIEAKDYFFSSKSLSSRQGTKKTEIKEAENCEEITTSYLIRKFKKQISNDNLKENIFIQNQNGNSLHENFKLNDNKYLTYKKEQNNLRLRNLQKELNLINSQNIFMKPMKTNIINIEFMK